MGLLKAELIRWYSRKLFLGSILVSGLTVAFAGYTAFNMGEPYRVPVMFTNEFRGLISQATLVALFVGASFANTEWTSGAMRNLLTWRTKRLDVLTAKLAAAFAFGPVLVPVLMVLLGIGLLPAMFANGLVFDGVGGIGALLLRGALLVSIFGSLGVGLAILVQRTTLIVLVVFAYAIAEPLLTVTSKRAIPWIVSTQIIQIMGGERGAMPYLKLSLYLAAVIAAAHFAFLRRDV